MDGREISARLLRMNVVVAIMGVVVLGLGVSALDSIGLLPIPMRLAFIGVALVGYVGWHWMSNPILHDERPWLY